MVLDSMDPFSVSSKVTDCKVNVDQDFSIGQDLDYFCIVFLQHTLTASDQMQTQNGCLHVLYMSLKLLMKANDIKL